MKRPIYVRPLTDAERQTLQGGLRSSDGFRLRRCQILLASDRGQMTQQIARVLHCAQQTVRNVVHAFNAQGCDCLTMQSRARKSVQPTLDAAKCERLQEILHQSPRTFDKPTSLWTLDLAAQVCLEEGLTPTLQSDESIRRALKRLGTNWKRAKHWIHSPDPQYALKKSGASG